jgi:hypothetical protein
MRDQASFRLPVRSMMRPECSPRPRTATRRLVRCCPDVVGSGAGADRIARPGQRELPVLNLSLVAVWVKLLSIPAVSQSRILVLATIGVYGMRCRSADQPSDGLVFFEQPISATVFRITALVPIAPLLDAQARRAPE